MREKLILFILFIVVSARCAVPDPFEHLNINIEMYKHYNVHYGVCGDYGTFSLYEFWNEDGETHHYDLCIYPYSTHTAEQYCESSLSNAFGILFRRSDVGSFTINSSVLIK